MLTLEISSITKALKYIQAPQKKIVHFTSIHEAEPTTTCYSSKRGKPVVNATERTVGHTRYGARTWR